MKLVIGKPEIEIIETDAILSSIITFDEWTEPKKVYYCVQKEYASGLLYERADAFLVLSLAYAMSHSKDNDPIQIICQAPISERLYYQLNVHYIPTITKNISWCSKVDIIAELDNSCIGTPSGVATGISGGVDSYYTLLQAKKEAPDDYKVQYGLYFELEDNGEFSNELQSAYRNTTHKICDDLELYFVDVKSNSCSTFYRCFHEAIDAFLIASYAIALSKLFKVYYISAAHTYEGFEFADDSSEVSMLFNVYSFNTENLNFYVTGANAIRHEKTSYIADFKLPQNYLMVCRKPSVKNGELKNCSRCSKCTRTMIDLDIHDKLDNFYNIFDVSYYRSHKNYFWGYLFFKGKKDRFAVETLAYCKENKIKIPITYRISGLIKIVKNGFKRGNPLQFTYRP